MIETCLRKMLIERDVKGAEEYTKQTISDLLQNKVDLSQLVITKALAKAGKFVQSKVLRGSDISAYRLHQQASACRAS